MANYLNPRLVFIALLAMLMVAVFASLAVGSFRIDFSALLASFFGGDEGAAVDQYVLFQLRLPRTLTAIVVGAGLAICGVCTQGLFRNPLADPSLIGVSSGSALGAVLVIVMSSQFAQVFQQPILQALLLPLAAFLGGLLATWLVYKVASKHSSTDTSLLLLAGIAINAICGAATGLLAYIASDNQLRDLTFWQMGSVAKNDWAMLAVSAPIILIASMLLLRFKTALNSLLLGENVAQHIGFELHRIKRQLIFLSSVIVGTCVAISGLILFVGLVVPHILRSIIGPDHRLLLPASMLLGAVLLLVADIFSRTVIAPAELPIGLFMSLIGGPFFLLLLIKQRTSF